MAAKQSDAKSQAQAVADSAVNTRPDGEIIAAKAADNDAKSSSDFVRVLVVASMLEPTESNGYSHEANKASVRQNAIDAGLRPNGDVVLKSSEKNAQGGSVWDLTYAVPVQLAADYDPAKSPVYVVEPGQSVENTTVSPVDGK